MYSDDEDSPRGQRSPTFLPMLQLRREVKSAPFNQTQRYVTTNPSFIQRMVLQRKLESHEGCVNALSFTPDGNKLFSGSDDLRIKLWDWQQGTQKLSWHSGHLANVFQCRPFPASDGSVYVSTGADGHVIVGYIKEGSGGTNSTVAKRSAGRHFGRAHKIAFCESPWTFMSCGEDGNVLHFDLRQPTDKLCTELMTLTRRRMQNGSLERILELYSIACNPLRPNEFAVGGGDEAVRCFDLRKSNNGRKTALPLSFVAPLKFCYPPGFREHHHVTAVNYSSRGELLASYDEFIYLFAPQVASGILPDNNNSSGRGGNKGMQKQQHKNKEKGTQRQYRNDNNASKPSTDREMRRFSKLMKESQDAGAAGSRSAQQNEQGQHYASVILFSLSSTAAKALSSSSPRRKKKDQSKRNTTREKGSASKSTKKAAAELATEEDSSAGYPAGSFLDLLHNNSNTNDDYIHDDEEQEDDEEGQDGDYMHESSTSASDQDEDDQEGSDDEEEYSDDSYGDLDPATRAIFEDVDDYIRRLNRENSVEERDSDEIESEDQEGWSDDDDDDDDDDNEDTSSESSYSDDGAEFVEISKRWNEPWLYNWMPEASTPGTITNNNSSGQRAWNGNIPGLESTFKEPLSDAILQVYSGHLNQQTIKGVSFFGADDEWVMSGSDDGYIYFWSTFTGEAVACLHGDAHVVNCLERHPLNVSVLATSGIEDDVKIWDVTATEGVGLDAKDRRRMHLNVSITETAEPPTIRFV